MGRFMAGRLQGATAGGRGWWSLQGPVLVAVAAVMLAGVALSARGQPVLPPSLGSPSGGTRDPRQGYDVVLAALAEGTIATGLDVAAKENRGGIRAGSKRWID